MRARLGRPDVAAYGDRFDLPEATGPLAVTFLGVSTLLFDDGETAVLFDGFFSRPPLWRVGLATVRPDEARIDDVLGRLGLGTGDGRRPVAAVVPVHSHFDHAMDSAVVAERTGAVLVGGRSTLNVGRGGGMTEDRLVPVSGGSSLTFGGFGVRFAVSAHCPPDRFPGTIEEPVVPPVKARDYRCGEAWSVLVEHGSGPTALVQGSAGFVPGSLEDWSAQVAYLGVGQLGVQPASYLTDYWEHTVRATGAQRVVLTHWDDFFRPLDQPLRALPYAGDDLDVTIETLDREAARDGASIHLPTVWRREDPWHAAPS